MKTKTLYILSVLLVLSSMASVSAFAETPGMTPAQRAFYELGFGVPRETIPAPDFSLRDLNGNTVRLGSLRGNVVIINLWATWCPPCRVEKPTLQKLHDAYGTKRVKILSVGMPSPPRETEKLIRDYIAEHGYTFTVLLDDTGEVFSQYGSGSIPTSWVVDTRGNLAARMVGAADWNSAPVIDALSELLKN